MVSVPRAQRPPGRQSLRWSSRQELIVVEAGVGVVASFSHQQMRLLLALADSNGCLTKRVATRVMWPDQAGALTPSMRASAARAITRLSSLGMVTRADVDVTLTGAGRRLVDGQCRAMVRLRAGVGPGAG